MLFYKIQRNAIPTSQSEWIHIGKDGKLVYKKTEKGDRILDFSYAGYKGGGVKIPDVPVKIKLNPTEGDNTDVIQKAIDEVSKMPMVNGFRGAVQLQPGIFNCERTININANGVVLRGSGSSEKGSVIYMTGKAHLCISVKGNVDTKTIGNPTRITDAYVPSGAISFTVASTEGLNIKDTIRISSQ
jgi:hypothetical protein